MNEIIWHAREADDVLEELESAPQGLSPQEAESRLERHGKNELHREERGGKIELVLKQFKSPLIYILLAAVILSLVIGHFVDAGVIAGVILLNAVIGVIQEWRAENALAALKRLAVPHATVIRDGAETDIEADQIVPGDILLVDEGDKVSADARLIDSEDLQVIESSLTGESSPAAKTTEPVGEDVPLADRTNMIWMSDSVVSGSARAVVVATGMNTEIGKITKDVQETERQRTPIQQRIDSLGKYLGIAGLSLGALVFIIGVIKGRDMGEMLFFAVAMSVSAIPEGLPAVISITLALGVQRMADEKAVVRRMPAVETLGSTTVICSDKTGTITQNRMVVKKLWAGSRVYKLSGHGYDPEGTIEPSEEESPDDSPLNLLLETGALANNARLRENEEGWDISGDPTEAALLVAARKGGVNDDDLRDRLERVDEIPFSSDRKFMAVLVREDDSARAYVKGSTEVLLEMCGRFSGESGDEDMTDEMRGEMEKAENDLAGQGLRVLAGGYADMPPDKEEISREDLEGSLVFCGLWGMEDPPREEAVESIKKAQHAGIRIVMITGDQPATARSIAARVGIIADDDGEILTGAEMEGMDEDELAERVKNVSVFARVSPHHKVAIKDAFRRNGETVAMSGDGVNDAPALKGADIGVAMGQTGTEVAREAADLILMDDNFATIVKAVEEGRVIFDNLRRVVFFLITTSAGEVLTLVTALIAGMQLPLTPIMILWINLVTDGASNIPLGVEPKHRDVLNRPPLKNKHIFDISIIRRMLILSPLTAIGAIGLFLWAEEQGDISYARTVSFTTLASFQWFLALTSRSQHSSIFSIGFFRNKWLLAGIGAAIILQLGVIYTSFGHAVFDTAALGLRDWLFIIPVAGSILVLDEILKLLKVHS